MLPLFVFLTLAADSQVGGRTSPDGSEQIQIDLPGAQQLKNVGGRDGAGLCVFTSVEHSGRYQNVDKLIGFQNSMRKELGGGWPEKLDKMLGKYAQGTAYLQYSGDDPGLLRLALKTGRMPAVTYGYSPRYGGSGRIAHMVNLVHLSDRWAAILDNNFIGENNYEWMAPAEFTRRWKLGGGGWAVFLLAPPPPPPPAANVVEARPPRKCWGATAPEPAVAGPAEDESPKPAVQEPFLFGVDLTRSLEHGHFYNGRKISSLEATQLLEGDGLTDDSHKLRITIISPDAAANAKVKNDLEGSPWGPFCLVQAYAPEHWAVTGVGFQTAGSPRIIVQEPPGSDGTAKVIHSQADYEDGLNGLISALRRKAPNYDPSKDKDGRKGSPVEPLMASLAFYRALAVTALVAFVLGWFGSRLIPAALEHLHLVKKKVFPPRPTMEETIALVLQKMKEQESTHVKPTDPRD